MVPREPFNKMKPNSGLAAAEPRRRCSIDRYLRLACGHTVVIDETREPLPYVARFVKMADDAFRAPSNRKCQASQLRHDREHALRSEEHTSELQSRNDISYAVFCL